MILVIKSLEQANTNSPEINRARDHSLSEIVKKVPDKIKHDQQREHVKIQQDIAELKLELIGSSSNLSGNQLRQAAEEVNEIQKRKLNLIIHGLHESDNDAAALIKYVNRFHDLPAPIFLNEITDTERLGSSTVWHGKKPRILRVKLQSASTRRTILTLKRWRNECECYFTV